MNVNDQRLVIGWLYSIIFLVLVVLLTGGITRLTHSGLSITEWKPIMGVVPPLSLNDWLLTFEKYKATPEYLNVNFGIGLDEFKNIFFWEYFHRLLARGIGFWLLIFWGYFNFKKVLNRKHNFLIGTLFILGGLQGVLGWYMVKSGLVNNPFVSHFRLAAHLSLALLVISFALYIVELIRGEEYFFPDNKKLKFYRIAAKFVTAILFLTIVYGAFTAGTRAGFMFNTFPLMDGELIPGFLFNNFFPDIILKNPAGIQFVHRVLGVTSFIAVIFLMILLKNIDLPVIKRMRFEIIAMVTIQVLLGIATLVMFVPLHIAVTHQLCASVLFLLVMKFNYKLHKIRG